jgi:uncharacterized membrane protein (UPF0127 family)
VTPSSLPLRAYLAALLAAASLVAAADAPDPLPRLQLHAGAHTFNVEVARTPQQRQRGVMGRTRLDDDAGMLFVLEQNAQHCFWMKDTLIPLSIAFLAGDGRIVDIEDMQPQTLDFHCAPAAVSYALEVNQGGFSSRGIRTGMLITGGPIGAAP